MQAVTAAFPGNPPDFIARVPHGYHDAGQIRADLAAAGFQRVTVEVVRKVSRAVGAREAAKAICQGTPMRNEILARDAEGLGRVTELVAEALAERFGMGNGVAGMQALVVLAGQGGGGRGGR